MSRWLWGALVVAAAIGLAACTSVTPTPIVTTPPASSPSDELPEATPPPSGAAASEPAEDTPLEIEVVESGFSVFPDDGGGFASYGAILHNPNTGWSLQRAEVHVDFLDASGAFIAGEEVGDHDPARADHGDRRPVERRR